MKKHSISSSKKSAHDASFQKILTKEILLFIIIAMAVISNIAFFSFDNSIKGVDSPNHLLFSLEFFETANNILSNPSQGFIEKWTKIINLFSHTVNSSTIYWPNGLNASTAVFYFIWNTSFFSARLSLLPYLIILLLATYALGELIAPKSYTGILAAFIIFMYPIIFQSSRCFQLDFPLTALVALTIFLFLKSNFFTNRNYCILSSFSLGTALLIKGQTLFFTLGPLIFIIFKGWQNAKKHKKSSFFLVNSAIFFVVLATIFSIWWGHFLSEAIISLHKHIFSPELASHGFIAYPFKNKFFFEQLTFYCRGLLSSLGIILFVGFVMSLTAFKGLKAHYKKILLLWTVPPFLLFSIIFTIKEVRFIMPILPALAVITAYGILKTKQTLHKKIILIILISCSLLQFSEYTFNSTSSLNIFKDLQSAFPTTSYETIPIKRKLKTVNVITEIKKNFPGSKKINIGLFACGNMEALEVIYWLKAQDNSIQPISLFTHPSQFIKQFNSFDVILLVQHAGDPSYSWMDSAAFWETIEKRHPIRFKRVDLKKQIPEFIGLFQKSKNDFILFKTIENGGYGYDCYYIFIRNKTIGAIS